MPAVETLLRAASAPVLLDGSTEAAGAVGQALPHVVTIASVTVPHGIDAGAGSLQPMAGLPPDLIARFERSQAALRAATDAAASFAADVQHGRPVQVMPEWPALPHGDSIEAPNAGIFWHRQHAASGALIGRLQPPPAMVPPPSPRSEGMLPEHRPNLANVNGEKLMSCTEGANPICYNPNDPLGQQVCASVTPEFWSEVGYGPLSQLQGKVCVGTRHLGDWVRGDSAHEGVEGIDCAATSVEAVRRGDEDAARFIFTRCPKAQRLPSWPSPHGVEIPLPKPSSRWPRLCTDPFAVIGDLLGLQRGKFEGTVGRL